MDRDSARRPRISMGAGKTLNHAVTRERGIKYRRKKPLASPLTKAVRVYALRLPSPHL
jgi:hypothetical protein